MPFLVLDLETVLDPAMPPYEPRGPERDPFPPAPFWSIVCAGLLWADDAGMTRRIGIASGEDEAAIVAGLVALLEKHRPAIVTFNGRKFDLPVLRARAMRYGVPCPYLFSKPVSYRYSDDGHQDIGDVLTDHGAARYAGLDAWSRCCGWPGKLGEGGADVAAMVAQGRLADVQAYAMEDVAQEHGVALRLALARGALAPERYVAAVRSLLAAIDAEPRLARLAGAVDRGRVLLGAQETTEATAA